MFSRLKKIVENKIGDVAVECNGSSFTFPEQVYLLKEHLQLINLGFGFHHPKYELGEAILSVWIDCLKKSRSKLLDNGVDTFLQQLNDSFRLPPEEERAKINEYNSIRLNVFEGFAGYGGASFGLNHSGIPFQVVGFSEFDKDAIELYQYNFPYIHNWGDITKIDETKLPDFNLFTGGFPCQPFSTVGSMLGELDTRGTLFADIIRICEFKQPQYILLENVKGLKGKKHKPTFDKILSELRRIGYDVRYEVLNSKDYGIPQNRERLWIFGYLGELPESFTLAPPHLPLQGILADFLDPHPTEDLYKTQAQVDRIHQIHHHPEGIFDVDHPMCYDIYNRKIRTDDLCMTVTPPEHNVVRIVEPMVNGHERFRKLSLDEHFRLMGFHMEGDDREILFPPTQDYTRLGRRAGNGWDVNLVGILFNHIFGQLL